MHPTRHILAITALLLLPATAGAAQRDRDHDRMPDRWEKRHHVRTAAVDQDRDGLTNLSEYLVHTNPRSTDSDHDGVKDGREDRDRDGLSNGQEQRFGSDATRRDSDGDGVRDGDEGAGSITAMADGSVTVTLARGGTLTGAVTARTEIECEHGDDAPPAAKAARDDDREDEPDHEDEPDREDAADHEDEDERPASTTPATGGASREDDEDDDKSGDKGEDAADHEDEDRADCTAADLAVGVLVAEAELHVEGGVAVFEKLKLVRP
ncbi:MAG: hypothetical protein HZB46_15815 [Solirubrobacterales bacterium]|nr:hypothetical protein [Solirubrobacterales bacterium]